MDCCDGQAITDTTQHGDYIVYLFSENMESVYLTLAQEVTVPKDEFEKKEGYNYLEKKASKLRELLPLEGMHKDDGINLTSRGAGDSGEITLTVRVYLDPWIKL
nr:DUF3578 domain-containing protein [Paenibacillus azoreducens]